MGARRTSWTGNRHPVDEGREPGLMQVNTTRPQSLVDLVGGARRVRNSILIDGTGPALTLQGDTRANRSQQPAYCASLLLVGDHDSQNLGNFGRAALNDAERH